MKIDLVQAYRVQLPLREPYHLSYGSIHALDSVWIRAQLDNGAIGWGESTPLLGYSNSDIHAVWEATNELARTYVGKEVSEVLPLPWCASDGFLFTALWTALEEACGVIPSVTGRVPLVGLTQEMDGETPASALRRVRHLGFRVFKVKVGFKPVHQDIERLLEFQHELREGEGIRIDANQALSEQQTALLLEFCTPGKIELLEQPLPATAWAECARIAQASPVPIMLDESITDVGSLEKAAQTGACKIVKLKWMKQGGMGHLKKMVDHATKLGLEVVLGNGVAGWIDNRHEGIFWLSHLQGSGRAGEMNGSLKIERIPSSAAAQFEDGHLNVGTIPLLAFDPESYATTAVQMYRA